MWKGLLGRSRKTIVNNVTINNLLPGPFVTDRIRTTNAGEAKSKGVAVDDVNDRDRPGPLNLVPALSVR
ncbi:hypothetical protein [Bradyrhizobium sp. sGM-13]|uniref:hypothetical protein n=1 Tax=Bradyrhizobium sp. sGM-13 TaxID=2831781 RepID=UPI001BCFD175|nr:hypothetical protein [Bradyrhizobium sp. sGM-13]